MKFRAFEPINLKEEDNIGLKEISLSQIFPNTDQPRKNFDVITLQELSASIKQYGVLQPIIVKAVTKDLYQIIAGERRWRASKLAELNTIPAIVKKNSPQENSAISLIENIQRDQLNPIELAESFQELNESHQMSHEAIAQMLGKSRATVTNLLRLLSLAPTVRKLLIGSKLEMGHARALLTLPAEKQIILAQKIVEKQLSVRDTEKLVQQLKSQRGEKSIPYADEVDQWVKKMSQALSSKVSVKINERGEGRVVIHFGSPEEMDWLAEQVIAKVEA